MGVVSNAWFDRISLNYLHVQTLMLTDVQTPLGPPKFPLHIGIFPEIVGRRFLVGVILVGRLERCIYDEEYEPRIVACAATPNSESGFATALLLDIPASRCPFRR